MTAALERPDAMGRAEAAWITDAIRSTADDLWGLLLVAYERQAWSALGYATWREYATSEFGMSQSRAYQLLDAAKVGQAITEASGSTSVEITEAEARDLKPVLAEVVEDIKARTADAPAEAVPSIVRGVIDDARGSREERQPFTDGYDRAVADLSRLAARFTRLHCDDAFMTHRASLGRRHAGEIERCIGLLSDVVRDLRAGQGR